MQSLFLTYLLSTVWTIPDRGQHRMEKFHFEFVVTVWTGIIGRFTHPNSEIGLWFLLLNPPSHGETSKDRPHVTERCTDAVCQLSGSIGYERFHFLVDRFI